MWYNVSMIEIWKNIPNYVGLYQVSNFGRVKNLKKINKVFDKRGWNYCMTREEKILKSSKKKTYLSVGLYNQFGVKYFSVHKLVAIAFLPNPKNKKYINHIDGNKHNNLLSNLEWCTASENIIHAYKTNLMPKFINSGEKNGRSKLNTEEVLTIKETLKNMSGVDEYKFRDLAEVFGVSRTSVFRIAHNTHWLI